MTKKERLELNKLLKRVSDKRDELRQDISDLEDYIASWSEAVELLSDGINNLERGADSLSQLV